MTASRTAFLVVRNSNVVSMEKLPFFIHGTSITDQATAHNVGAEHRLHWKAKFGGMDVSEAKRLKALEEENAKLKKLLAEQMRDAAALRELLAKKW